MIQALKQQSLREGFLGAALFYLLGYRQTKGKSLHNTPSYADFLALGHLNISNSQLLSSALNHVACLVDTLTLLPVLTNRNFLIWVLLLQNRQALHFLIQELFSCYHMWYLHLSFQSCLPVQPPICILDKILAGFRQEKKIVDLVTAPSQVNVCRRIWVSSKGKYMFCLKVSSK